MKIAVTGATGFIGRRLIRDLIAGGHSVCAFVRNKRAELGPGVQTVVWDGLSGPAPHEALAGADGIVNLAGEPVAQRWTAESKKRMWDSRIDGTRNLLAGVAKVSEAQRPKALISASAIGIYGSRGDEVLTESSTPAKGFLGELSSAWEQEADRAAELGLRVAKLRIGIVLGPGGGALEQMLPIFRLGIGGTLGSGRQWMSWIHIDDIVGMLKHLIEHDVYGVWNGVSPNPVTNSEFTHALGEAIRRPAILPVPEFAIKLLYGEMATVVLASQRVFPRAAEAAGFRFHFPVLDLKAAIER